MALLEVHDLHKSFGGLAVLSGVSFSAEAGEVVLIMGASGGGKSTLLKIIIGALKPDRGRVVIDNLEITSLTERELDAARVKYGVLFQNPALLHSLNVAENVALPLSEHSELDPGVIEIMVRMKLSQVGLSEFENFYPNQLSGGMQKRVGLARAIARDPKVVFFDEPTAGLDPVVGRAMTHLIHDFSRALNITAVVISHEVDLMLPVADKVVLIYNGEVVISGTRDQVLSSEDPLVRQFIRGEMEGPIPVVPEPDDIRKTLLGEELEES
jgi:phospholipid/cholesterol/gamma-HCH transport system ATP-binding protein